MTAELHEPTFDGTTDERWIEPDWEAMADGDPAAVADHFLLSKSGFPPESVDDLAVPVVDEQDRLNLHALADAASGLDSVEGTETYDDDLEEAVTELCHELIRDNFESWPETKAEVGERLMAWRQQQRDHEHEVKQKLTTDDEERYAEVKGERNETGPERPEKGR